MELGEEVLFRNAPAKKFSHPTSQYILKKMIYIVFSPLLSFFPHFSLYFCNSLLGLDLHPILYSKNGLIRITSTRRDRSLLLLSGCLSGALRDVPSKSIGEDLREFDKNYDIPEPTLHLTFHSLRLDWHTKEGYLTFRTGNCGLAR